MTTKQAIVCSGADSSMSVGLERTRFFPRQLITPDDLTQDQRYFRDKLRRHNRLLHGWGVVCGARIKEGPDVCEIIVEPGYILGPYGDEILIDREVTVNLCREGLDGNAVGPCGDALDPWCSDVRVERRAGQTLYVAVRYAECQARPVRVHPGGCGCEETDCEYSRIRDSFAIKVLTRLPSSYSDPMPQPDIDGVTRCAKSGDVVGRPCPPCPTEPWVILADVVLSAKGEIDSIDCFAHRRYVVSFAEYYYLCVDREPRLGGREAIAREMVRRLGQATLVDLQAGLTDVAPKATVPVRRADGSWVSLPAYFSVEPGETAADFLAREGDREYYDPETDRSFTLREIYALGELDPHTTLEEMDEVLTPLEGIRLRIEDLRVVRAGLEELLDSEGMEHLERDHAGTPAAASNLLAVGLRGVSSRSALGKKVADMTVADVGAMDREAFVARAVEDVPERRRTAVETQAREVWNGAVRVARISRAWGGG
jgi:hypothetical protein